jgi:hypothetical protein
VCAKIRSDITMSVQSLEEDLQFVQEFHTHMVQIIEAIKGWERTDAAAIDQAREDGNPDGVCYDEGQSRKIKEYTKTYRQLRTTINLELVRLRNIAGRYQLAFNENWIYKIPTSNQRDPNAYTYSFDSSAEAATIRDIDLILGALNNNLREEKRQAARSRWIKVRDDYLFPGARWFLKPEHSKFTLIAGLAIVLALVLRSLGYDSKTIVEIVKAMRGCRE